MTDVAAVRHPAPALVRRLDIAGKALLVLMLGTALAFPELGNLEGKGAVARAVAYPALAFTVPVVWHVWWRERASFPWLADLLITITCFTDILGNRIDLYDTVVWFDDWMHFMNTGLLAAAVILLTLPRSAGLGATLERALAFGATAAIGWELAEYFAFISESTERRSAYTDTLGDLTLGLLGCVVAALAIHTAWRRGKLRTTAPQLEGTVVTT
ncbi:hypothetical protein FE697_017745 [Mumia zhuanghuii]|uniref:VanZ like family protein n=2 Tax=Mumia TaxID=1546255 RepID=A0ABW1QK95_9ACTN|nr:MULTISPECIES: hypothetical protein [Mumia]KAA1419754.1 hypothetical protein FE697_017745 [Mumia zhuanghuii]